MRVLVLGASGLIGSAVCARLAIAVGANTQTAAGILPCALESSQSKVFRFPYAKAVLANARKSRRRKHKSANGANLRIHCARKTVCVYAVDATLRTAASAQTALVNG